MPERALNIWIPRSGTGPESRLFNFLPPLSILYLNCSCGLKSRICLRLGELAVNDSADTGFPQELTELYQILEDIKVPDGEEEFEVRLDLVEDKGQMLIRLIWSGESETVRREIVLTR